MHSEFQLGLFDEDDAWLWGLLVGISHHPFKKENSGPQSCTGREEDTKKDETVANDLTVSASSQVSQGLRPQEAEELSHCRLQF